ncbi:hypothetical protein AHAS_Ahas20G0215000 [Arachis hypogaea]
MIGWTPVSALIERWCSESYIFQFSCGELTITLQDVAYQLGFQTKGDPFSHTLATALLLDLPAVETINLSGQSILGGFYLVIIRGKKQKKRHEVEGQTYGQINPSVGH